jgi:predicted amidophosphoribosyltransferase
MEIREPVLARCPTCGRPLKGGICSCGTVMPRKDNTFVCKCGNVVDAKRPVCKKCGAVYEAHSETRTVFKELK